MIGGRIIEAHQTQTEAGVPVIRLWCVSISTDSGRFDETAVYAAPYRDGAGPKVGDMIWWQGGRIYFDRDRKWVRKVGYSFDPRKVEA